MMYPKSILHYFSAVLMMSLLTISSSWAQCDPPTGATLTPSSETAVSATFTWTASPDDGASSNLGYQWQVRTSGVPADGLGTGYVASGNTADGVTTTTVSGLQTLTSYQFYVRYQCDDENPDLGDPNFSLWTSAVNFTTTEVAVPIIVTENNIMDVSFNARWQHSAGASHYLLSVYDHEPTPTSVGITGYEELNVGYVNSKIVTGLSPNTEYWYRVKAVGGSGPTLNTSLFSDWEYVITEASPPLSTTWTGAVTGWVPVDPNYDIDVIIDADFNTSVNGTFEAKTLTVNPGKFLTIAPGVVPPNNSVGNNFVFVQNEIINNSGTPAGITVESNGNLGQDNETYFDEDLNDDVDVVNSGEIIVKRLSSPLFRLDYTMWSSPVVSDMTLHEFSPLTSLNRFYDYDTDANNFVDVSSGIPFVAGKGYLIRVRNTHVPYVDGSSVPERWMGQFVGVPRNGEVLVALQSNYDEFDPSTNLSYNMVGNPYPTAISAEEFIADNTDVIEPVLHFWRRKNDSSGTGAYNTFYASYTQLGGITTVAGVPAPSGEVATGQGFLVNAIAEDNLLFDNTQKLEDAASNVFFRSQTIVEKHRIWLNLTHSTGAFSQMLVGYMTGASNGIDLVDGKFINDAGISLTSSLNENKYVIQGRALPFDPTDVVPLNFSTPVAGDYTIAIDHFDGLFDGSQDIFLRDNAMNVVHDLKAGGYTFATEVGDFADRFEVVYQNALNTGNPVLEANNVVVYKQDAEIMINAGALTIASVKVFDIRGRLLAEQTNVNASETSISAGTDKQVLIVQITSDDNRVVSKKIVN